MQYKKESFELPKISRLGKAIPHIITIISEPLSPASIWKDIGTILNPKSGTIHEITSISISLFPNRFAQTPHFPTTHARNVHLLQNQFWPVAFGKKESERRMHALANIL
jgi:hypothetical protein